MPHPREKQKRIVIKRGNEEIVLTAHHISKLTPEFAKQFCDEVKGGMPLHLVCNYLGIGGSAFHKWLRLGSDWIESEPEQRKKKDEPYAAFVLMVKKAHAEARRKLIKIAMEPGNPAWVQAISILERIEASMERGSRQTIELVESDPNETFL